MVFLLQLFEPMKLGHAQTTVLYLPVVGGSLADVQLAIHLGNG
jgi:hypothetical protein